MADILMVMENEKGKYMDNLDGMTNNNTSWISRKWKRISGKFD